MANAQLCSWFRLRLHPTVVPAERCRSSLPSRNASAVFADGAGMIGTHGDFAESLLSCDRDGDVGTRGQGEEASPVGGDSISELFVAASSPAVGAALGIDPQTVAAAKLMEPPRGATSGRLQDSAWYCTENRLGPWYGNSRAEYWCPKLPPGRHPSNRPPGRWSRRRLRRYRLPWSQSGAFLWLRPVASAPQWWCHCLTCRFGRPPSRIARRQRRRRRKCFAPADGRELYPGFFVPRFSPRWEAESTDGCRR